MNRGYETDSHKENLLTMKSFDNLVARKGMKFSQYQSIQYHTGQTEVLKCSLIKKIPTVYFVGLTDHKDLDFLNKVLTHVSLQPVGALSTSVSGDDLVETIKSAKDSAHLSLAVPIQVRSCVTKNHLLSKTGAPCFKTLAARNLLIPSITTAKREICYDFNVVTASITKEHDDPQFYGLGSLCIQISEAFSLQSYISRLHIEDRSSHLVKHLCFDISRISAAFAPNLVAFIILYIEKDQGPTLEDLMTNIDWFRKTSIDTDLQIGFSGDTQCVVEFALLILRDFIKFDSKSSTFSVKVPEKLLDYACLVIPRIAFYGVIARAVLVEFRKSPGNQIVSALSSQYRIRVMKDNVMNISHGYADSIERLFPCRRPCTTIEQALSDALEQMNQFGKYLKVEEPQACRQPSKMRWAGDSDDDEEYFWRNRNNPALKTWLLLTQRQYRLDRLNMFINAIDEFIGDNL